MGKTIAEGMEDRGRVEQARESVRIILEARFGPLPEAVVQGINALDDLDRLNAAARLAARITKIDDFQP